MKFRGIFAIVLTLAFGCVPALAQVTPGTSPLSIPKGGTGGATAAAARTSLGLGTIATQNANAVAVTGGSITGLPTPSNPSDAATKSYADGLAAGLTILAPSRLATAAVLPNTPTYNNGASGVGATLTAGSNSTLTVDGTVANLNDVVLVNNQASAFQNGIYTVTTAGSGSAAWVLTRATYFNQSSNMLKGSYTLISAGTTNLNSSWVLSANVATVGTTAVSFNAFAAAGVASFNGRAGAVIGTDSFNGRTGAVVPTSGDYNAGQITYTPPGTGAVSTTVQAEVQRYGVWANDFGALCNGGGNDLTAFQNAINAAQTFAVPMKFTGTSCVVSGTLNITATVDMSGQFGNTTLYESNLAANLILVNTTLPVYLHDFSINYTAVASAGATAITVTVPSTGENSASVFERLSIGNNNQVGINFQKSSGFRLVNSVVVGLSNAVIVANGNLADSGDSTISGNQFQSGAGSSTIVYNSSGGLRFINNKINGSANILNGFQMALTNGATTADLFIIGNSIEGINPSTGNGIFLGRSGATGGFGSVIISGNEITGNIGVSVPTDANGVWLNNLIITNNICVTCTTAGFAVDSAQGIVLSNNFIQPASAATVPIAMGTHGPTSTNCVVGPNPHLATAAASVTTPCTAIAPN